MALTIVLKLFTLFMAVLYLTTAEIHDCDPVLKQIYDATGVLSDRHIIPLIGNEMGTFFCQHWAFHKYTTGISNSTELDSAMDNVIDSLHNLWVSYW